MVALSLLVGCGSEPAPAPSFAAAPAPRDEPATVDESAPVEARFDALAMVGIGFGVDHEAARAACVAAGGTPDVFVSAHATPPGGRVRCVGPRGALAGVEVGSALTLQLDATFSGGVTALDAIVEGPGPPILVLRDALERVLVARFGAGRDRAVLGTDEVFPGEGHAWIVGTPADDLARGRQIDLHVASHGDERLRLELALDRRLDDPLGTVR